MRKRSRSARQLSCTLFIAAVLSLTACSDSEDDDDEFAGQAGGQSAQPTGASSVEPNANGDSGVSGGDGEDNAPQETLLDDDDAPQETLLDDGSSRFIVPLSARQEVPPVDSETAEGRAELRIDRDTGAVFGTISVSGLSGEALDAHIHEGIAGTIGEPLIDFDSNDDHTEWTVHDGETLDAVGLSSLASGELYINVHTEENRGGELRGQIIPLGILFEESDLSGDEEVPPVDTDARGVGVSTVNPDTGAISATVFTIGLEDATVAHIHEGSEGENGDPIIFLEQDPDDESIWRTPDSSFLTDAQLEAYENEGLYFNVHTEVNPDGEIRGQL